MLYVPQVQAAGECLLRSVVAEQLRLRKSALDINLDDLGRLQIGLAIDLFELVMGQISGHQLFVLAALSL